MNKHDDRRFAKALKRSLQQSTLNRPGPVPAVLRKLDTRRPRPLVTNGRLIGLSASVFLFFPQLILLFAYHL